MFTISKRSAVARTPTRSEQVRALWVDFELWHAAQSQEVDNKIKVALKDLEQKWRSKSRRPKKDSKEYEEEKIQTRLALKSTLDGNVVRQEWDRRLRDAGLVSEDWIDVTEDEQRKIEMILGADLEFEEDEQPRFPESYAIVDPNTFNSLDDAWLEVKQRLQSDDQLSLDASTSSASSISETWNTPAYALWSSEASRSSAQSSQTSSPEWHSNKPLVSDASSAPSSRPSTSTSMSSHSRTKSHGQYVGPHLTSDTEDEETSFEKWKLSLRIQKIHEFHEDAAAADIQLTLDLDEARREKSWSKEDEAQRVRAHEADMLALRERKEAERKAAVESERQRRRAELRQQPLAERDFNTTAQKFLKTLQLERDIPSVSDTPTIRQNAFSRTRKQSLSHLQQQEWPESGNDTPTPTTRTSGWSFKKESTSSGKASTFGEAPPLKRLATAPASVVSTSGTNPTTLFGDNASTHVSKAIGQPAEPPAQKSAKSFTKAEAPAITSPASTKKSKKEKEREKEKAKVGKKANTSLAERKESNDETNVRIDEMHQVGLSMPGQWGWGGDPAAASSSSISPAVTGKPSTDSTISFLASTPSTSSLATYSSSSSHSSSYSYPFNASNTSNTSLSTHSLSGPPPISLTNSAPTAQAQVLAAVPDNRRVWFPPGALESNLNNNKNAKTKQPTHAMLEVPGSTPAIPIQKAASGPGNAVNITNLNATAGMLNVPVPIQKSVSEPSEIGSKVESTVFPVKSATPASVVGQGSQLGGSRDTGSIKPDMSLSSKPAHSSSSTTKPTTISSVPGGGSHQLSPPSSSASSSYKKKSKGKKKVTIEEALDEEDSGPNNLMKGKGIERLPTDSRYIMEPISEPEAPKPVVSEPQAQEMFREIFDYKGSEAPSISVSASTSSLASDDLHHRNGHNLWTPPVASTVSSSTSSLSLNDHERWLPSGGSSQSETSSSSSSVSQNDHERWIPKGGVHEPLARQDKQEKRVRWTPSAYAYDAPAVPEQDGFLSMLNSLEAIVTNGGSSELVNGNAMMGSAGKREANKKAQGKGRSESNSDETFWQHAMTSLGRGGNSISAPSAM